MRLVQSELRSLSYSVLPGYETNKIARYEYISHFICNAGTARFTGMDYIRAAKQILLEDFIGGVTNPVYKLQRVGDVSEDGLGYIWQSNLFGHYILVRPPCRNTDHSLIDLSYSIFSLSIAYSSPYLSGTSWKVADLLASSGPLQ